MSERRVTMVVREPAEIELVTDETVQLDRLVRREGEGVVHERHGALLRPGASRVRLDRGMYAFRMLRDAELRVVHGGVDVSTAVDNKDPWPRPPASGPSFFSGDEEWAAYAASTCSLGDGPAGGPPPRLVVVRGE